MCRIHLSAMKTQGQGHSTRSWDLPLNFVPAPYPFTPGMIFNKLWSNVDLSEMVCRTHDSATQS